MPESEFKIISVRGYEAASCIDAIEGLVFDPQPYKVKPNAGSRIQTKTGRFHLLEQLVPAVRGKTPIEVDDPDPIETMLKRRYSDLIAHRFYQLTQSPTERNPEREAREYPFGSRFYVVNECQPLLVNAGEDREYTIDLQLVRDAHFLIVYSFLDLHRLGDPKIGANILMCSPDMARISSKDDVENPKFYVPSFIEQQRLLVVNDLQRKYSNP